jgi:hypothetical protein
MTTSGAASRSRLVEYANWPSRISVIVPAEAARFVTTSERAPSLDHPHPALRRSPPMRSALLFFLALCPACVTSVQSVQRAMLGPLAPPPLLNFDTTHGAQLGASAQLRLLDVKQAPTTSGLGVPLWQGSVGPMVRVSPRFAFGGQLQYVSPGGAQYKNAGSGAVAPSTGALGLQLGGHFTAFEHAWFAIDGAVQLSLHGLPVSVGSAPGPLGTSPSTPVAAGVTLIPGVAVTVLPRVTTRAGVFFVGLGAHTNADIDARGLRITTSTSAVQDDLGSLREVLGQVGLGYAHTFDVGLGLQAQAWVPLGGAGFGAVPTVTVSVFGAFGRPPVARPEPRAPPPPPSPVDPEPAPESSPPPL